MTGRRTIKQGDNDWADIPRTDGLILTSDWVGTWAIVTAVGATATVSGTMPLSTDNYYFQRRITPANTLACPVGNYLLVTQIKNDALQFSQEISHERIAIVAQGITS
jgi:hypothetical protein